MVIQLTADRKITSDNYQYELRKLTKVKGADVWVGYLFFTSLKQCLRAIPEQLLKESSANGWLECKKVLDDAYTLIDNALKLEPK